MHALGGAADAEEDVGAGAGPAGGDRAGDVAVGNEADPGARGAHLGDEVVVTGAVEDDGGEVAHRPGQRFGQTVEVLGRGAADVASPLGTGADGHLLHVDARSRVEHGAPFGHRDHRECSVASLRGQRRPVDRIDGDVRERRRAVADLLAVEQHRRVVLLALADDDDPVHGHAGEHRPHRLDCGGVGSDLVASSHPTAGGHGGGLGRAHQVHGEVAIGGLHVLHHAETIVGGASAKSGAGTCQRRYLRA